MTNLRDTDPRNSDPRWDDKVLYGRRVDRVWGWIAGLSAVALMALVIIASLHGHNSGTATSNNPIPTRSTTGSGSAAQ